MAEEKKIYTGREFIKMCVDGESHPDKEIIVEGIQPEDYKMYDPRAFLPGKCLIDTSKLGKVAFEGDVILKNIDGWSLNFIWDREKDIFTEFKGKFIIQSSSFVAATFSGVKFRDDVHVSGSTSLSSFYFADVEVTGGSSVLFKGHTFGKAANFRSFKSKIPVIFEKCEFNGPVYFDDITSFKSLRIDKTKFSYDSIDMTECTIEGDFRFLNCSFFEFKLEPIKIVENINTQRRKLKAKSEKSEKSNQTAPSVKSNEPQESQKTKKSEIINTCKMIEKAFVSSNNFDEEDKVFFIRKGIEVSLIMRVIWGWFFRYGRKPSAPFLVSCGVIVIFSLIFYCANGTIHGVLNYKGSLGPTLCGYINSLYFSMITFATVGFGDVSATGTLAMLAAIEGLIGLFVMPIFAISLARKLNRSN